MRQLMSGVVPENWNWIEKSELQTYFHGISDLDSDD